MSEPAVDPPGDAAAPDTEVDSVALERAFLKGLGVPDLRLPDGLTPDLIRQIGALLREATHGTIELLRLRSEAKSSLHADMTLIGSRDVNPLKAAWDADVALEHLLAPQRNDVMQPLRAVADAYDDLRLHDRGLAAGILAAVAGLLERLSPDEIARRAGEASAIDHLIPGSHKARLWEHLLERYEDLSVEAKEDFWRAFETEFRRAYTANGRS